MSNLFAKLGSITYVLWGILHVEAARKVYVLGQTLDPGMVQGRIFQDAWNLLFFAIWGIVVGLFLNWKNSRLGYWLNLTVVSAGDIGYIVFVLIPGFVPFMPGALGPILWVLAVLFSTVGIVSASQREKVT
jgi:CHASE2 domain-containing sensor protein